MTNFVYFLLILIPVSGFAIERYLDYLNTTMWSDKLPDKLKGICDEKEYSNSQRYQKDNNQLSFWSSLMNLAVIDH